MAGFSEEPYARRFGTGETDTELARGLGFANLPRVLRGPAYVEPGDGNPWEPDAPGAPPPGRVTNEDVDVPVGGWGTAGALGAAAAAAAAIGAGIWAWRNRNKRA